jgi:hypothetical protein
MLTSHDHDLVPPWWSAQTQPHWGCLQSAVLSACGVCVCVYWVGLVFFPTDWTDWQPSQRKPSVAETKHLLSCAACFRSHPDVVQGLSWVAPEDSGGPPLVQYRVYRAQGVLSPVTNSTSFAVVAFVPANASSDSATAPPRVFFNASTTNPAMLQATMPNTTYVFPPAVAFHRAVCHPFDACSNCAVSAVYPLCLHCVFFSPSRYTFIVTAESLLVEGLLTQCMEVTGRTPPPIPCPNDCSGHGFCGTLYQSAECTHVHTYTHAHTHTQTLTHARRHGHTHTLGRACEGSRGTEVCHHLTHLLAVVCSSPSNHLTHLLASSH